MKTDKTYLDNVVLLYENNKASIKQIEELLQDSDCPVNIKEDILKPIRQKFTWLKLCLESKFESIIKVGSYKSGYNESITLNEITRTFKCFSEEEREVIKVLMQALQEGHKIEIKVNEPEEELF